MTQYANMPEMGVSIPSDGVGKPFTVRPTTDDDFGPFLFLVYVSDKP